MMVGMLYADWQLSSCQNSARLSCQQQLAIVLSRRVADTTSLATWHSPSL